jgi:hypothetical protein
MKFNIKSIPQSVIIGPDGNVVWRGKPLDLNEKILSELLAEYENSVPVTNRIVLKKQKSFSDGMKVFENDRMQIRYRKSDYAANEFSQDGPSFYLSGKLDYIVSVIKGVPVTQVTSSERELPYFQFVAESLDKEVFFSLVQSFICRETPYKIKKSKEAKEVYNVREGDNMNLFSDQMYDFEKGNNVPLIDDWGIMIDNATIEQMLQWLTARTGIYFNYRGKDKKTYDWNIQLTDTESLLKQLTDELGFEIEKADKKIRIYKIVRKIQ